MKKQTLKILAFLAVVIVLFASCAKENDLKESVFISDPDDYRLPAYSEWGYNTFGAYYDRDIFISNDVEVPVKVIVNDTATIFLFSGYSSWDENYWYYNNSRMTMSFTLKGVQLNSYTDLIAYNDSIVDLAANNIEIDITKDTSVLTTRVMSGNLHFKRSQNLFVDDEQVEVILSGIFDFKAVINNEPVTISEGRFDFGINEDNFYNMTSR